MTKEHKYYTKRKKNGKQTKQELTKSIAMTRFSSYLDRYELPIQNDLLRSCLDHGFGEAKGKWQGKVRGFPFPFASSNP